MSESSNRLEEEFAEITRCFADHPQISIVSTDGTPVNQYVIEYRLNGLVQLDDGEVVQSDQHRIELSLSFGFPHFPPNCKPLTKIFHPDMDPSAIKIAEFWADSTSLAKLISHIGEMICWQSYSSQDGFNPAALDWLSTNKSSVPMDTLQGAEATEGATLPGVDLDLGLNSESAPDNVSLDLGLSEASADSTNSSFVDDLDFDFTASPTEDDSEGVELSLDEPETPELDLGLDISTSSDASTSVADDIDFDFKPASSSDGLELDLPDAGDDDTPLELSLENENIKPVENENFAFVAAGDEDEETDIVVEQVAIEEPDLTPSFPVDDATDDIDLDLAVVDVDYDILKGMIDQRNYIAAQTKLSGMAPESISKAAAVLQPMIEQRVDQANGIHQQAKNLENEGLLEDAANKLEALMNLVQDYPNLEADMKRVRDAWAGVSSPVPPAIPASNLGLEKPEMPDVGSAQVRDTMLTETVVSPTGFPPSNDVSSPQKASKKKNGQSFFQQNRTIVFAGLGLVFALCVSGWTFMEWRAYSQADQKWGEINSLLEKDEYQQVQNECAEIRLLLARVHIILGGGKKEILGRVDDLLKSEHFLEGFEGKVLWQGQYISKRAFRAYEEIKELVEEAKRRGALSKWQESAVLYREAFRIAKDNKKRLNDKFYAALELDVKNSQFANLVSLGKQFFISTQWPQAIEKFEAALKLASQDGVADPSISYDVNRYLQRAWFSQYVIDGDEALKASDYSTASVKFNKAYAIAKDPNLIDDQNRQQVLVKLNQSSLIKIMDDAEGYVAKKQWPEAVKLYTQAKKYTMDGYPLIDKGVSESQRRVEGLLISTIVGMEREIATKKRSAHQYIAAEAAYGRILTAIYSSSFRDQPTFQKIKRKTEIDKNNVHLKAIVDEKIVYLEENYRKIVAENFTGVSVKALSNVKVTFLSEENRALQFKIQCREQRESKYYTLELIYQYDVELDAWGFPEM